MFIVHTEVNIKGNWYHDNTNYLRFSKGEPIHEMVVSMILRHATRLPKDFSEVTKVHLEFHKPERISVISGHRLGEFIEEWDMTFHKSSNALLGQFPWDNGSILKDKEEMHWLKEHYGVQNYRLIWWED